MESIEDGTIRLGGRVRDIQARRKALRVARERGNTRRVHDELAQTGEPTPHDELADKVKPAQRARRNCWYLPGVHEVHNQRKITSG